jgi:hypothetical protein
MLANCGSSPIHFYKVNNAMVKRNASVARCAPNPARLSSINLDLRSVTPAAVRLRLRPEQCCHLQLLHGPITAGTIPSENTAFTTCVDPISPPRFQPDQIILKILCQFGICQFRLKWWRRRVPPPGPLCLFHSTFIAIAGKPAPSI